MPSEGVYMIIPGNLPFDELMRVSQILCERLEVGLEKEQLEQFEGLEKILRMLTCMNHTRN